MKKLLLTTLGVALSVTQTYGMANLKSMVSDVIVKEDINISNLPELLVIDANRKKARKAFLDILRSNEYQNLIATEHKKFAKTQKNISDYQHEHKIRDILKKAHNQLTNEQKKHFRGVSIKDLISINAIPQPDRRLYQVDLSDFYINSLEGMDELPRGIAALDLDDNKFLENVTPDGFNNIAFLKEATIKNKSIPLQDRRSWNVYFANSPIKPSAEDRKQIGQAYDFQ